MVKINQKVTSSSIFNKPNLKSNMQHQDQAEIKKASHASTSKIIPGKCYPISKIFILYHL